MTIYKLDKLYTFHISKKERKAISELKKNGINVSRFLRRELRRFGGELALKEWEDKNE
jgi:lipid II:glycine glycyltransferase (peptidoglycan interpeptide bridge formation enzyme)